jgi:ectoine hydroxylase-related dioxygenase (phytanoyl-CoA dioxygenase family)
MSNWQQELTEQGYCVIKVLSEKEVEYGKSLFQNWWNSNNIGKRPLSSHGVIKHYNVGHTAFAWWCRTRPSIQKIFKQIWQTEDLIVSYDGACYYPSGLKRKTVNWLHVDQEPNDSSFKCVQGFVCFTENQKSTLMVVPKSHLEHKSYMKTHNLTHNKAWQKVDVPLERAIHVKVKPGDLVLWDSRVFHQNSYSPEERLVQYVCYLPRSLANSANLKKREKYFNEKRTTSHWPTPVRVNGLQPQIFGKKELLIDYSSLINTDKEIFKELSQEIKCLV